MSNSENRKQELECLFDSHCWVFTLTEAPPGVFVITSKCKCCGKEGGTPNTLFSLNEAFKAFTKQREDTK